MTRYFLIGIEAAGETSQSSDSSISPITTESAPPAFSSGWR